MTFEEMMSKTSDDQLEDQLENLMIETALTTVPLSPQTIEDAVFTLAAKFHGEGEQ